MPVIDRVRALNPAARLVAYGLYAPLNAALLREHGVSVDPRRRVRGRAGRVRSWATRASARGRPTAAGASTARVPRVQFLVPDRAGPAGADDVRDAPVGHRTPDGRLHRGQPRLQASLPPLSDRAGLRRPLSRRPGRHRHGRRSRAGRRRRQHITFGDPDFFNGIGHALAVVERFAGEFPGVSLRRHDQGRAPARARRRAAAPARHRLRVRHERGRSRSTIAFSRASRRGTRAPTSSASWRRARESASRWRRRSWRSRRGRRSRAIAICCRRSIGWGSSSTSSPIQLAIRLLVTEGSRLLELAGRARGDRSRSTRAR